MLSLLIRCLLFVVLFGNAGLGNLSAKVAGMTDEATLTKFLNDFDGVGDEVLRCKSYNTIETTSPIQENHPVFGKFKPSLKIKLNIGEFFLL